jgi:hypothetical protein
VTFGVVARSRRRTVYHLRIGGSSEVIGDLLLKLARYVKSGESRRISVRRVTAPKMMRGGSL